MYAESGCSPAFCDPLISHCGVYCGIQHPAATIVGIWADQCQIADQVLVQLFAGKPHGGVVVDLYLYQEPQWLSLPVL